MSKPIYLDYNGTTPHDPEVIDAMRPFLEHEFGNPSSSHWYGVAPKRAVEAARHQVADLLNCAPQEIIFTSGGTEANNHAIKGIAETAFQKGNHIITTEIEHPAVLEVFRYLEHKGYTTTYVPVDDTGVVRIEDIEKAITPQTILITVMHANNEVGTIQPIEEIAELAKAHHISFHTDAAQSVGKIPTDVKRLGVDMLSLAGHKIYGPKGVGALYVKDGIHLPVFCHGAGQEGGRRAGTENVMEIAGLGKACEIAKREFLVSTDNMRRTRDRLEEVLHALLEDAKTNGNPQKRLPNTLSISFRGLEANRILEEIASTVAASAGAACHSDHIAISHVLKAMDVPEAWAKGTLRFTTGRMTTDGEIDEAINVIVKAVQLFRQ
jgi:cysteine desulfurase